MKAALTAAVIALCCVRVAAAQPSVTVDSLSAERSGNAALIHLQASAQADFYVDRYAAGDWVFVWSPQLSAGKDVKVIPADFSQVNDVVTKARLARDGKHSGVRIYLTPAADRRAVGVKSTADGVTVTVPLRTASQAGDQPSHGNQAGAWADSAGAADRAKPPWVAQADKGAGIIDYALDPAPAARDVSVDQLTPMPGSDSPPPPEASAPPDLSEPPPAGPTPPPPGKKAVELSPKAAGAGASPISTPPAQAANFGEPAEVIIDPAPQEDGRPALDSVHIEHFEVVGTPLDQALQLLIAPTGYNAIIDASVGDNAVSLSFKGGKTSLKSALDLITKAYSLDYVVQSKTIVIASKEKIHSDLMPWETRIFVLSYADPKDVRKMLVQAGVVSDDRIQNYFGEDIDFAKSNDDTGLSVIGDESGGGPKKIQTNVSTSPRNALIIRGTSEELARVGRTIAAMDRKPKQIQLEVRICEANETAMKDLGVSVSDNLTESFTEAPTTGATPNSSVFPSNQLGSIVRAGNLKFTATLNAQITTGNVTVLAQPVLSTTEGKQAVYFAGERIPYISQPALATGSATQAPVVKYVDIGVLLNFKPRLDRDGLITMDINPSVSTLESFLDLGSGASAPRIQTRQAATTRRVRDGETITIAGLINSVERDTTTKVPGLGDIPIVGRMFRDKKKDRQRTEIIMIITPHITE